MPASRTPLPAEGPVRDAVLEVVASFGLACTDTSGYGLQRLYMDADAALYRAKHAGRNRVIADSEIGSPSAPLAFTQ